MITLSIKPYLALMRIDRPIGFLLLLWPTYWALWLAADGKPKISLLIIFTLGVIIMRAAGCVINDILDRRFDRNVTRTRQRPLASGQLSVKKALVLFLILCLLASILLIWLNPFTRALAVVGLVLTLIYPLLKRYTHLPQLGFAQTFSWGILLAFAAQTNHVPMIAWLLYFTNCIWCIAYDSEYAMADRQDDLKIGVKSTAILFADYDRLIIGILQLFVLTLLFIVGQTLHLTPSFYIACLIGLTLFLYQQWLIKNQEPQQCLRAFSHNHWFGMVIFGGILLGQ